MSLPAAENIQNGIEDKVDPEEAPCLMAFVPGKTKLEEVADKIVLYANQGFLMTPEQVAKIYQETAGVDILDAKPEPEMESDINPEVEAKNPTDVSSFSIIMDHIDMDILQYVAKLFEGKKISVSIDVHQMVPVDRLE